MPDELLEKCGFNLLEVIKCPIPGVNPEAKQLIYKRVQSDDVLIFDTQQNGIKLSADWCDPRDFEAIVAKAKELGMIF